MSENYCHLINITNAILGYTTKNVFLNISCENQDKKILCNAINQTFIKVETIPFYNRLTELLKQSLDNTLDCNTNLNLRIKYNHQRMNIFEIVKLILFGVLIYLLLKYSAFRIKKLK
jgi:hypothetical protein